MPEPTFHPAPGDRLLRFVGDLLECQLNAPEWNQPGWSAFLRTSLGRANAQRAKVVAEAFAPASPRPSEWQDLPMKRTDGGWKVQVPLVEVGFFHAKPFAVDPAGRQHWPAGPDAGIVVHPDAYRSANTIYCAFTRLMGESRTSVYWRKPEPEPSILGLDAQGYAVIPPSGTLRDLKSQLDHIFDRLGFRILHLLPVNPTPTTFARFGRYGSPYAGQDLTAIDQALVEFDKRTTGVEQFIELTEEVHQRGGRIFIDLVINHTGWGSTLYEKHPEWFLRNPDGSFASPGAWGTVWEDLVELHPEDPGLWEELATAFLTWCRRGVDGFRCDAGYKVPVKVWKYIAARVRQEFPDTLFLLEGLGGGWWDTEAILTEGGMQWAYSELFQEYSAGQVSRYLDHALKQSSRVGLLVNYSETHDNNRLAARGRQWSLMRNRLSALTSPNGAYGITCGVEWLAPEKIVVHQNSGLAWDQPDNLISELKALNGLLSDHPCFHDGAVLTRLNPDSGDAIVILRTSQDGANKVLVVINPDETREGTAIWKTSELSAGEQSALASGECADLLKQSRLEIALHQDGQMTALLAPAAAHCLELTPMQSSSNLSGEDYRHARARAAWGFSQLAQICPLGRVPLLHWRHMAEMVNLSPAAFLTSCSVFSSGGGDRDFAELFKEIKESTNYRPIAVWEANDTTRISLIPAGHWTLFVHPFRFDARIFLEGRESSAPIRLAAIPTNSGWVHCLSPGQPEGTGSLVLMSRGPEAERFEARLEFLPDLDPKAGWLPARPNPDDVVLLTNGRGGMARMRVELGEVRSKYDCVLGANLSQACPVDRHVFVKRIRFWANASHFLSQLDFTKLESFRMEDRPEWTFLAPAGGDLQVGIKLTAWMQPGLNTVCFKILRQAEPQSKSVPLSITVRTDIEDRSFHGETKRNGGADHHFNSNTQPLHENRGFRFAPALDRVLTVKSSSGTYHPAPEWSEHLWHRVEETRGQESRGDAYSPGWFEIPLAPGESCTILITSEDDSTIPHENPAPVLPRTELRNALLRACDDFLARRGTGLTIIAGYPWFLDWGRDSLIAARGLLSAGKIAEVRDLVRTFARFEENGTLPNSIHGQDASNRETSDAPLWIGIVVEELACQLGDADKQRGLYHEVIDTGRSRTILDVLTSIATHYIQGTPNGVRMDSASGLIWSPSHFTWMDTNYPAGTPREGYPIEIQALWVRLLRLLAANHTGEQAVHWAELAEKTQKSIESRFWIEEKGWYADSLAAGPSTPAASAEMDDALRSNALFLVSLGIIRGIRARRLVNASIRHLLVPGGLRSLAPLRVARPLAIRDSRGHLINDPHHPYWGSYEGEEDTRRKPAYHNGTAWVWTFPTLCEAMIKAWPEDPLARQAAGSILMSLLSLLKQGCIGQLPEILDGNAPHSQRGCDAQAWSVTEGLRVLDLLQSTQSKR